LNSRREIGKKQGGYNRPCVVSVKQPIDAPAPSRRTLEGLVNAQGWGRHVRAGEMKQVVAAVALGASWFGGMSIAVVLAVLMRRRS